MPLRLMLCVVVLAGLATPAASQPAAVPTVDEADWSRVEAIPVGTMLHVDAWSSTSGRWQRLIGEVLEADADGVVLLTEGMRERLPRSQTRAVSVVDTTRRDSVKNGAIIGAIAGAAYGIVVATLLRAELEGSSVAAVPVYTAAFGAGTGALIDWLRRRPKVERVYP